MSEVKGGSLFAWNRMVRNGKYRREERTMLAKIFGMLLLIVGGMIGLGVLVALIGTVVGLLWFAIKLAVPLVLVYAGYRLLTRDRRRVAY